jgi:hypothetical protein
LTGAPPWSCTRNHGLALRRQGALGRLGGLLEAAHRHRVLRHVDPRLVEDVVGEVLDDGAVPVLAAERAVAAGGQHLEDAVLDRHDRDVEGAAAEVEDGDDLALLRRLVRAVGERRRGRLVEDAHDVEAGDGAGVAGRLPLHVVEVGGHRHHGAGHRLAERGLGDGAQAAQHVGGDLLRALRLAADLDPRVAVGGRDHAERRRLGDQRDVVGVDLAADQALGAVDRRRRVAHHLAARRHADHQVALGRPADDRRGGAFALGSG